MSARHFYVFGSFLSRIQDWEGSDFGVITPERLTLGVVVEEVADSVDKLSPSISDLKSDCPFVSSEKSFKN